MPEIEKPGGLSYEVTELLPCNALTTDQVVLEEARKVEQPQAKCPPTPTLSAKDIDKKLKVTLRLNN